VKRLTFFIAALLLSHLVASPSFAADLREQTVRIGAFNYYPGIFKAKDSTIQGFYVDIISEVARREGWQVQYVYGDWADGISRIKKGELDLITSVAWTKERTQFLDYAKVPLLTVWGELYIPGKSHLNGIREVEGKKVGVMKGDFNGATFRNKVEKFGIACDFVEYGNFEEIFRAVSSRGVDAGVVNSTFGAAKQYQYGLSSSGIIFNPFDIFLAVPKGENAQLLRTLDKYLASWRAVDDSPYHKALKRWSHGNAAALHVMPGWLIPTLIGSALVCVGGAVFIVLLRLQVRRKTMQMVSQAGDRQKIEETLFFINDCGSRYREDQLLAGITQYLGICLEVDYAFVAQLLPEQGRARTRVFHARSGQVEEMVYDLHGTPCENVIGKVLCVYPSGVAQLFPQDRILAQLEVEGYAAIPLWNSRGVGIGLLGVLSRRPLQNTPLMETVIQIASSRVAQELEAMSHLEALNLKNITIENIKEAVYWILPDGRIRDVNSAASGMLGYTREQLLTMSIQEVRADCSPEKWLSHWDELKQKGNLRFEAVHRAENGCAIPVEVTANYCSYNGTEYNCAIVRNITERKLMEEALERRLAVLTEPMGNLSEIGVQDLFDLDELQVIQDCFAQATGVASIITDAKGHPITRPSNFCSLCIDIIRKTEKGLENCYRSDATLGNLNQFGPTLQPCLSGGLWDGGAAIHVAGHHVGNWLVGQVLDEACDHERMMSYAEEIGADPVQYRQALAKVTRMPREQFEKVCQALFQITGQLSRMAIQNVQQAQHISERKRSEDLLLEYRKVIECSQDLICVIDRDYRYRMANGAFLKYRRLKLEEVVGHTAAEVLGADVFAGIRSHIDDCLAGRPAAFEMENDYPGKGVRSLAVSCIPIEDKHGSIRVACVISDRTEKKHLEEQLRQSQKMEAVGHLAGGIAHDFNNILTVIVGYGNFLEMDGALSPQQKEQVEQIIAASEKGSQLTRGLLAFSRKQIMNPRILDLDSLVNQVHKFLLRIIGEDIQLKFTPHAIDLNVFADGSQLEQILMNLATNARDAMPKGGVLTIETGYQDIDAAYARSQGYGSPGRYACMTVSDTGTGMDRETRERIFEPFFSTKMVGKGTGLGMSIVYGIVKQHKGFINVYSEPGDGTAFKIYLPVVQEEPGKAVQPFISEAPEMGTETVLVAEDDAGVRKLVESLLSRYGYTVILAVDGHDCVEKYLAHKESISLILMDVIMPGKNGKEAFDQIRAVDPDARVLYTSGYTADFMQNRGVFDEAVDLIMKPVQPMALLKTVREILDRSIEPG